MYDATVSQRVEADLGVQRFAFTSQDDQRRLDFPHASATSLAGTLGTFSYSAEDVTFEALSGRLDTLRWQAEATSVGTLTMRDESGTFALTASRVEFPSGLTLVRGTAGVEVLAPHVSFSELTLKANLRQARQPSSGQAAPGAASTIGLSAMPVLRQGSLRFLDAVSGMLNLTVKVQLDLPVLGKRTLDQDLSVPLVDGRLDFRALDKSLDWLEGTFVDIDVDDGRLAVSWGVPLVAPNRDIISWALDDEAQTMASFGRVPLRALADFRIGTGKPSKPAKPGKRPGVLQAFALENIDVAIALTAPRSLEAFGGLILFGGDDAPGIVDLKVTGSLRDPGASAITGTIGVIDTTFKDVRLGPVVLSADRLHLGGVDSIEVEFEGFVPTSLAMTIHRVTASNLSLKIGS